MILILDNYDSFTWNLVQAIGSLRPDADIRVVRNDRIDADGAERLGPSHLIVSPGPCGPAEAGSSVEIIRRLAGRVPILGVCLGHQCIGAAFGMRVSRHAVVMHGKTSRIEHDGRGVLAGVESPLTGARYHSLVVEAGSVPAAEWEVSAWIGEGGERVVMGMRRVWEDGGECRFEHAGIAGPRENEPGAIARPTPHPAASEHAATLSPKGRGNRTAASSGRGVALLEGVQFHPESFMTPAGSRIMENFLAATMTRPFSTRDRDPAHRSLAAH